MPSASFREIRAAQTEGVGLSGALIYQNLSLPLTKLFLILGVSPNTISWISFSCLLVGAGLIATAHWPYMLAAGLLIQLACALDSSDGEVARLTGLSSPKGAWLDAALDRVGEAFLFAGLGLGLYNQLGTPLAGLYAGGAFAALFVTHALTLLTAQIYGKGTVKEELDTKSLGSWCSKYGIPPSYIRLGFDVHLTVFAWCAMLDRLMWIVIFFWTVQNIYWLILFVMVMRRPSR